MIATRSAESSAGAFILEGGNLSPHGQGITVPQQMGAARVLVGHVASATRINAIIAGAERSPAFREVQFERIKLTDLVRSVSSLPDPHKATVRNLKAQPPWPSDFTTQGGEVGRIKIALVRIRPWKSAKRKKRYGTKTNCSERNS
jgi:hypothetical protein